MNVRHAAGRHITVEGRLTLGGTSGEHLDLLKTPSLRRQLIDNSVRRQPAALRRVRPAGSYGISPQEGSGQAIAAVGAGPSRRSATVNAEEATEESERGDGESIQQGEDVTEESGPANTHPGEYIEVEEEATGSSGSSSAERRRHVPASTSSSSSSSSSSAHPGPSRVAAGSAPRVNQGQLGNPPPSTSSSSSSSARPSSVQAATGSASRNTRPR
jgi:hypothetical protein